MVVGGDTLGYQIVKRFEDREQSTQLVERDPERAAWLANQLQGSTAVEADATNVEEFGREQLPDIDLIVGVVDDDTNYLITQLARELGTAQIAAIVDDPRVLDLFEESGLDVVIHPEDIIVGEILQMVYQQRAERVSVLEHDNAEVFETVVDKDRFWLEIPSAT